MCQLSLKWTSMTSISVKLNPQSTKHIPIDQTKLQDVHCMFMQCVAECCKADEDLIHTKINGLCKSKPHHFKT